MNEPVNPNETAPPAPLPFQPYAILYQFPSGEWYAEMHQTPEAVRLAAAEAAQEVAGRVVHVMRREAAVVQPPNALIWG